jgi:hypothetical protein
VSYLRKILDCKEVEDDVKEFRLKESKVKHMFTDRIDKDIVRTKYLKEKENVKLHGDVRKVLEFYCHTKRVAYC